MSLALYGADSGYVGFSPPAVGDGTLWELPGADGTEGQFLRTNGDGTLSWVSMQTPGMLATPTVLRSPAALPAELLPLLVDTDGQTSTLDTVADYRSLLGLGSAATADVDDFASYGTGTDRTVPVRDGTGRDLTDSLLTIDATTGLASLRGTAAAYRAYGPTGVPYTSLSHDGTSGVLATSSGDLTLSPASGITALAASQKIKWGAAGTGMQLSLTVGTNPQLNVRDHTDSYYARIRADTYYWNNGEFLYSDNAKMKFRKAFDAAYLPIWAGTLRAYDANTNYAELSHDGTNAVLSPSAGDLNLQGGTGVNVQTTGGAYGNLRTLRMFAMDNGGTKYLSVEHDGTNGNISTSSGSLNVGTNNRNTVLSGLWTVYTSNGAFQTAGQYPIVWSGQSVGLYPNSSGVLEINNGTAGAYRDLYLRSLVASQNLRVGSGFWLTWPNAVAMTATDAGTLLFSSFGASTANRIVFNGQTSAYPAIKRNGTGIDVRLADDSAYAPITSAQLNPGTAADVSIGGSAGADMFHGWVSSNAGIFAIRSNGLFGASNSATNAGGAVDIAWGRRASGAWEANNGSVGALRDVYARTMYGIAQASTDVAVCAQAHASQGSTSPILKVVNAAGSQLVGVLPGALQLGPATTMKLSFDGPTNVSGANYIQSSYDAFRFRTYGGGGGDWGGNTLSLGSINDDAIITNSARGYGLKLVAADGYGNANTAGNNITYCAGRSTGTATGGSHKFQVAPSVGVSGTTFGTLVDALTIASTKVFTLVEGAKWSNGSVTGTTHGTSSADKQAWWNSTPVAQSTGWGDWGTYTELKAFDPATVTLGELARYVATLSATLKSYGLLGA